MATKRKLDFYQEMLTNKKLKLGDDMELPADIVFFTHSLSPEISTYLNYDYVVNEFVIGIRKTKTTSEGTRETVVNLDQTECAGVLKQLPVALAVARKYCEKKASKPADVPFETKELKVSELGTILFVKENTYKRGLVEMDIRKCTKRENNAFGYTKDGVRCSLDVMPALEEKMKFYQSAIEKSLTQTEKMMHMAEVALLVCEIRELSQYGEPTCSGCVTKHPSQVQHMGFNGCLSEDASDTDTLSWGETVEKYWTAAVAITSTSCQVEDVAEMALSSVKEVKGLVVSKMRDMKQPEDKDLKAMVLDESSLRKDDTYVACREACAKLKKSD